MEVRTRRTHHPGSEKTFPILQLGLNGLDCWMLTKREESRHERVTLFSSLCTIVCTIPYSFSHKCEDADPQNWSTKGIAESPPSTVQRPVNMAWRDTTSNAPMPSIDTTVAVWPAWAIHSVPARVDKSVLKRARGTFNRWTNLLRATRLLNTSLATLPRTLPFGF